MKPYMRGSFYEDTWSLTSKYFDKIVSDPSKRTVEVTNSLGQTKTFSQEDIIHLWNNSDWKQSKNGSQVMVKVFPF